MNNKLLNLILLTALTSLANQTYAQVPTHCKPNELVYFSCQIKNSYKVVSLCGNELGDWENRFQTNAFNKNAWLQYRFGRVGSPEFVFPKNTTNSLRQFKGEYFQTNMLEYGSLTFMNGNVSYALELLLSNEEDFVGIKVTNGSRKVFLPCNDTHDIPNRSAKYGYDFFSISQDLQEPAR